MALNTYGSIADVLTRNLSGELFERHRDVMLKHATQTHIFLMVCKTQDTIADSLTKHLPIASYKCLADITLKHAQLAVLGAARP